jgi:hypothetical protein
VTLHRSFPGQVLLMLAAAILVLAWPLALWGSPAVVAAAAVGAFLSTVNVLIGYRAIEYARDKSSTTFLKVVLGGMGLRMGALLGLLALLITAGGMHAAALTVSLLGFYAVFLVLEVLYIHNRFMSRQQG